MAGCDVIIVCWLFVTRTHSTKLPAAMLGSCGWWGLLAAFLLVQSLPLASGGTCNGVETFEKVSGMTIRRATTSPLFTSAGTSVTAECNVRCRASMGCNAYITNYDMDSCSRVDFRPDSSQLIMATERLHYFEKICLDAPVCDRAWSFERVPNNQLSGFDDRVMINVTSRAQCEELCLSETMFPCMSAEYSDNMCRLSKDSRRTQPGSFGPAEGVDYLENLCANQEISGGCDFEEMPNMDVGHADLQRSASSREQCQEMCVSSRLFPCRAFSYNVDAAMCRLSSDDSFNVDTESLTKSRPGTSFYQRGGCLNMSLSCQADTMTVTLRTREPFMGRIYARDEPMLCEAFGNGRTTTEISMTLHKSRCGVIEESSGMFSNVVVIQNHPVLQRKGDKSVKLMCFFEADNRTVTSGMNVVTDAGGPVDLVNSTAPPPSLRLRIADANGTDTLGATLGDQLFLRVEIDADSAYDIFPRDLVARSGTTDESIVLLDSAGCPTDRTIFPGLTRMQGSRDYEGRFEAFKFSTDAVVRFTVNIQFCLRECPQPVCDGDSANGQAGQNNSSAPSAPPPGPPAGQSPPATPPAEEVGNDISNDAGPRSQRADNGFRRRQKRSGFDFELDDGFVERRVPRDTVVVSELNLQRQLLVNNVPLEDDVPDEGNDKGTATTLPMDDVCLSWTLLIIGGVGLGVLQICIIATCCVCLFLHRPRPKEEPPVAPPRSFYDMKEREHRSRV